MKRTLVVVVAAFVTALTLAPVTPRAQSSAEQQDLRNALELEKVKGETQKALEIYKNLAGSTDPKIAAAAKDGLARLTPVLKATNAPQSSAQAGEFPSELVPPPPADGITNRRTLPDGRIVGVRVSGSAERLVVSLVLNDPRKGSERELMKLAARPRAMDLEVAPDGRHFALIINKPSPVDGDREELIVASLAGIDQKPTVLSWPKGISDTSSYRPLTWSPDGTWLPYLLPAQRGGVSEVHLLNATTGQQESLGIQIDGPPDFRWSPAGAELAIHVTDAAGKVDEVQFLSVADRRVRRHALPAIPTIPENRTRLGKWTTKGELALQVHPVSPLATEVWLMSADTGRARKVCVGGPMGGFSPRNDNSFRFEPGDECLDMTRDGAYQVIRLQRDRKIYVRDTVTLTDRPLTEGSGEEHAAYLSPDNRLVVFISNRDGRWGLYAALLDRAPMSNPVLIHRLEGIPAGLFVTWTPAGMTGSIHYSETNVHKVLMDKKTGKSVSSLVRLTEDNGSNRAPSVSPDGTRIAYWSFGRRAGLTLMDADGANERQINTEPFFGGMSSPIWRSPEELITAHHSVNVKTGAAQPMVLPRAEFPEGLDILNASGFAYLPARQTVIYITHGESAPEQIIRARSLADGGDSVLTRFADGGVHSFLVSPQGTHVAFSRYASGTTCPCEFGVRAVTGGDRRLLETTKMPQALAAWSPDGRFLLYGPARPRIMDTLSGTSWTLMAPAQQPAWMQEGSWSPDGSFVVITVSSNRTETRRWSTATAETVGKVAAHVGK